MKWNKHASADKTCVVVLEFLDIVLMSSSQSTPHLPCFPVAVSVCQWPQSADLQTGIMLLETSNTSVLQIKLWSLWLVLCYCSAKLGFLAELLDTTPPQQKYFSCSEIHKWFFSVQEMEVSSLWISYLWLVEKIREKHGCWSLLFCLFIAAFPYLKAICQEGWRGTLHKGF